MTFLLSLFYADSEAIEEINHEENITKLILGHKNYTAVLLSVVSSFRCNMNKIRSFDPLVNIAL